MTPAFELQGNKAVFPIDTFDGREVVTLVAKQDSGSYDTSNDNLALITENHLGSSDPSIDKSVAGRGFIVRTAVTGVLAEITLDENYNIVIKEV
jgi:hypothetical protein